MYTRKPILRKGNPPKFSNMEAKCYRVRVSLSEATALCKFIYFSAKM